MDLGNKKIFSKNLKRQILKSGKHRRQIAEELKCSYSTLTDWINGNKYPRIDRIEMLAEYFGVSKSDLIEDFVDFKEDNDRLAAIIVKLRTNRELLDVVDRLVSLDKARLESLRGLLDTFV